MSVKNKGLIGRKIGMTQVFMEDGRLHPVTVVELGPNVVVQTKTKLGKDGYTAIKLGFGDAHKFEKAGTEPRWRMNRPRLGVFVKAGIETPKLHLCEFRLKDDAELDGIAVGQELKVTDLFHAGQFTDVTGTSKGRGFTGVMKRHNFAGAKNSHGVHENFRHGGSIGSSAWPSRVFPGLKMPGQHGNVRVTTQNLHIVEVDAENNIMLIKGAVPGPNGGIVYVRRSLKRRNATKPL